MVSNQLCLPCQAAIRSGRICEIVGPELPTNTTTFQSWACSLCITIQDMRPKGSITRKRRLTTWIMGQLDILGRQLALLMRGPENPFSNPLARRNYLAGVSSNAPNPPVGDLDDIVVMSHLLVNSPVRTNSPYALRVVPEVEIDRLLVKRWLSDCARTHDICKSQEYSSSLTLLLVDVQLKCLVAVSGARYFALSYVWGGTDQFLLKQENLVELKQEGALSRYWGILTNVLKDAITFVDSLSERYLWVDTLSIIQDSPGRNAYLSRMDKIYQGAVCTLVAIGSSHASEPLPGVQPRSRVTRSLGRNSNVEVVRKRRDIASAFINSVYEGRSWTFQERTLSLRCLYFMNEQVYYQCQEVIWSEDRFEDHEQHFDLEGGYPSLQWIRQRTRTSEREKFTAYAQLVTHYSKKELSYSTDRLYAFCGIVSSLEKAWEWNIVAGLPTSSLDLALLWTSTRVRRRIQTEEPEPYLPSWSWAGWTDGVHYRMATSTIRKIEKFVITTATGANEVQLPIGGRPHTLEKPKQTILEVFAGDTCRPRGSCCLKYIPNLLRFHTQVVAGRAFGKKHTAQYSPPKVRGEDAPDGMIYRVFRNKGPAGLLMHCKGVPSQLDNTYRYILIAHSEKGLLVTAVDDHAQVLEEGYELEGDNNVVGSKYNLLEGFACVLLIKASEHGYSERVAVGQIHLQAWSEAMPTYERTCLG